MRHRTKTAGLTAAMLAAVLLAGCRADSISSPELASAPLADESPDLMFARVVRMGFPADLINEVGDMYVVDGDMIVTKASLRAEARAEAQAAAESKSGLRPPDRPQYQYVANYFPALSTSSLYGYTPVISVDLSAIDAENANWAAAVRGAMVNWRSIPGAQVGFSEELVGGHPLTVVFGSCGDNSGAIACAEFPTRTCSYFGCIVAPGARITITRNFNGLDAAQKLFTMTHEMGHTIGFRHTNWNNRLCGTFPNLRTCSEDQQPNGAIHIPGTPTSTTGGPQSDPESVMNANVLPWNAFTTNDRIAARYLFPGGEGPAATLATSETPYLTWSPMQDAVEYEVWYVQPQSCPGFFCWGPAPPDIETFVGTTNNTSYEDTSRTRTSVCTSTGFFVPVAAYRIKAAFRDNGRKSNLGAHTTCWAV